MNIRVTWFFLAKLQTWHNLKKWLYSEFWGFFAIFFSIQIIFKGEGPILFLAALDSNPWPPGWKHVSNTSNWIGLSKTYSWIPNNRVYTQAYFENFPRYTVLFGTYTKPPSQALRRKKIQIFYFLRIFLLEKFWKMNLFIMDLHMHYVH